MSKKMVQDKNIKTSQNNVISNIPKKLDSSIIDKMGNKGSLSKSLKASFITRSEIKEKEQKELEKIEKLTTFNKIIKLQTLLKDMISKKKTFEINKNKMIEKINQNCFDYYKNKINMKEIYDYCLSNNLEEHINYILVKEPEKYFSNKYKDIFNDISDFMFLLRNNNKLMLKLIDSCEEEDYENLCDFLVNFCYEDTINSSFIQEELMLVIYLIIEKNMMEKLPKEILNNEEEYSYQFFRYNNIINSILKSLSRKADIRNFLCSILVDGINLLQSNRKYLSPDVFHPKDLDEDNYTNKYEDDLNNIDKISKRFTIRKSKIQTNLKLSINKEFDPISRVTTNVNKNIYGNILNKINKKDSPNSEKKLNISNTNNDELLIPENITEEDLNKITLDPFFENNNVTLKYIQSKSKEYEHISKNNAINLAIKEYLGVLIQDINNNKEEIYSNKKLINFIKSIKIKMNEEKKENNNKKNEESFDKMVEMIKNNYKAIIEVIDDIINKLKENITSVPVIIKCISNIIEQLLYKKYIERKPKPLITNYQKYFFKSNFFIGNILLSSIINPNYNGIFTSDLMSKATSENLIIIYNILDMLLSGKLFTFNFDTLFNKYIIEIIPKIFEIIDNIEKNFKLPDVLQRLVNTCTDIKNEKRLNDFEYDYFFEKNEDIQYQSLCFNIENLCLLIKLAGKNDHKIVNENEKKILDKITWYKNYLIDINKKNRFYAQKCEYLYIYKINFNSKIEKQINSILKDNFAGIAQSQNSSEIDFFKRCLIQVLSYANIISENSFQYFTQNNNQYIHNFDKENLLLKKTLKQEYNSIFNNIIDINNDINENIYEDKKLNFGDVLFQKIMEFIKYEIGKNLDEDKVQRVIFCTLYVQSNLKNIPKEYIENNYKKLFMELIKETLTILNYLNSNILNQLYNKIKEGTKLNMIITSNYLQIKNLEKFKIIEYLYSRILIPNKFNIKKDSKGIITKIEYEEIKEEKIQAKKNDNNLVNDFIIVDNAPKKPQLSPQKIRTLINVIPDFRKYEESNDDIIKIEEDCEMPDALKKYFKYLKNIIKKQKILGRFNKDEIDSIFVELENFILFKLYDKLYPIKSSKEDIKFYKKCCRLNFIKPENIITDKNIYNEKLWNISLDYLNEIDNKYTPQDKIKTVLKSFGILQNSISFCSGKKELGVDDTIKPLIYVLIKSKPKKMFSNYNYSQLFLSDDLGKTQYGILLTQIYMIMNIIKDMKYNDLIGVSEKDFGKDEDI